MKPWTVLTVATALCAVVMSVNSHAQSGDPLGLLGRIDHLVYATPDLAAGVRHVEAVLGIHATPGGQHPGEGTRNALIALGPTSYLEIIGPDPEQPRPAGPRKFKIDDLTEPRLVTWAAKATNLTQLVADARRRGVPVGDVIPGSRRTPGGVLLSWHISNQRAMVADGLVPFFIDWGDTPHPAQSAAAGATLIALRAEHPDPEHVRRMLGELGLELPVAKDAKPSLVATIAGTRGRVDLR
ncbi:MAG TPA: VOC family protein [Vicinamibacterales bacterium]|nr:VOC family protein [Vicinamibacterales bacterium]